MPAEFIGFVHSPFEQNIEEHPVTNHQELLANFIAQPEALALGKTVEELKTEGVPDEMIGHKKFSGNRPSTVLMFRELTPFTIGQLYSIYEHRTTVEGFIWDINSFDQWGVQLGKILAKGYREMFAKPNFKDEISTEAKKNSASSNILEFIHENI